MATRQQVERTLRELVARLDAGGGPAGGSLARSLPARWVLALRVTDLDAEYWAELRQGRMGPVHRGTPPGEADVRIAAASDDLVALADGRLGVVPAYLGGRIRVEAGLRDLLRLRDLA